MSQCLTIVYPLNLNIFQHNIKFIPNLKARNYSFNINVLSGWNRPPVQAITTAGRLIVFIIVINMFNIFLFKNYRADAAVMSHIWELLITDEAIDNR